MLYINPLHKMEQFDWDKMIAIISGIVGGMLFFMKMALVNITYLESLWKAGVTAIVCGL